MAVSVTFRPGERHAIPRSCIERFPLAVLGVCEMMFPPPDDEEIKFNFEGLCRGSGEAGSFLTITTLGGVRMLQGANVEKVKVSATAPIAFLSKKKKKRMKKPGPRMCVGPRKVHRCGRMCASRARLTFQERLICRFQIFPFYLRRGKSRRSVIASADSELTVYAVEGAVEQVLLRRMPCRDDSITGTEMRSCPSL